MLQVEDFRRDVFCGYLLSVFNVCYRLTTLGGMQASDELDDAQVRQILFDLESAYNAFNRVLHNA